MGFRKEGMGMEVVEIKSTSYDFSIEIHHTNIPITPSIYIYDRVMDFFPGCYIILPLHYLESVSKDTFNYPVFHFTEEIPIQEYEHIASMDEKSANKINTYNRFYFSKELFIYNFYLSTSIFPTSRIDEFIEQIKAIMPK